MRIRGGRKVPARDARVSFGTMRPPEPPRRPRRRTASRLCLLAAAAALGAGCKNPTERRLDADRETYDAMHVRRPAVPETVGSLNLDEADKVAVPARALGVVSLDLEEALRLAAAASREYRSAREDAYLAALRLTEERHKFE